MYLQTTVLLIRDNEDICWTLNGVLGRGVGTTTKVVTLFGGWLREISAGLKTIRSSSNSLTKTTTILSNLKPLQGFKEEVLIGDVPLLLTL